MAATGSHISEETSVGEQDTDDALYSQIYHQRDRAIIDTSTWEAANERIRSSIFQAFPTAATSDLGLLESLPLEVLQLIIENLDLTSVLHFTHTNKRAREVVSRDLLVPAIRGHALNSLRAAFQTKTSCHLTIRDLDSGLRTTCCVFCFKAGELLYLPTCQRCCLGCTVDWMFYFQRMYSEEPLESPFVLQALMPQCHT